MGKLLLTVGDITKQEACEAIVTISDSSLTNGGYLNKTIHEVAGPKMTEECKTLNGCEPGQAKLTRAYDLPNKYVIHTVGPVWTDGKSGEEEVLASCYYECLELAKRNEIRSIAFPYFSEDYYSYPVQKEAEIAFSTLQSFVQENRMWFDLIVWVLPSREISFAFDCVLHGIREDVKKQKEETIKNSSILSPW